MSCPAACASGPLLAPTRHAAIHQLRIHRRAGRRAQARGVPSHRAGCLRSSASAPATSVPARFATSSGFLRFSSITCLPSRSGGCPPPESLSTTDDAPGRAITVTLAPRSASTRPHSGPGTDAFELDHMRCGSAASSSKHLASDQVFHDLVGAAINALRVARRHTAGRSGTRPCSRNRRRVAGIRRSPCTAAPSTTTWPCRRLRCPSVPSSWRWMQSFTKVRTTCAMVAHSASLKRVF